SQSSSHCSKACLPSWWPRATLPSESPPTVPYSSTSGSTSRAPSSHAPRRKASYTLRTISTFSCDIARPVSRRSGWQCNGPARRRRLSRDPLPGQEGWVPSLLVAAGPARRSDLGCAGGKRRPVTSPHTASCLAAVAASAVIAGCGGGTRTVTRHGSSSAPAAPTPASPPAPPPAPTPAVAAGPATVCTQRSRVGPTYDTAVAFMITNQSDSAVV